MTKLKEAQKREDMLLDLYKFHAYIPNDAMGNPLTPFGNFCEGYEAARAIDAKRIAELEKENDKNQFDNANLSHRIAELEEEMQSNKNMFLAACESLGIIAKHLNIEPEQGGHAPILYAIAELEAQNKAMREAIEAINLCNEAIAKVKG